MTNAIGYSKLTLAERDVYWAERNALVDAVHAVDCHIDGEFVFIGATYDKPGAAEKRVAYSTALDALEAFDAAHGGTPVL